MDVSKNPVLEYLDCHGNQLSSLDLSGCPVLKVLDCSYNCLSYRPDTSKNPRLTTFKYASQTNKITYIKLSAPSKKIAAGKKVKLTAKVYPANASNKSLAWESSNPKFAKVSANGTVKAYKAGKGKMVKITCKSLDGSNKKKTVTIRIK